MAFSTDQVAKIMTSPNFDEADRWVVKWQCGALGEFERSLAVSIASADVSNLHRLRLGFPTQVEGFQRWTAGDLALRLREEGLEV